MVRKIAVAMALSATFVSLSVRAEDPAWIEVVPSATVKVSEPATLDSASFSSWSWTESVSTWTKRFSTKLIQGILLFVR